MNKRILLTLMSLLMLVSLKAQVGKWCLTDYFDSIAMANNPEIKFKRAQLENFTKNFVEENNKVVLIIPVVFHVVHNFGDENISKAQMEGAILQMNKDYRKLNSELSQVVPAFQPIIADVEVEFRLAKIDPQGNCTEGITRTQSMYTYNADNNVKYEVPGWNPSMYLNIWVVNSIASGAAAWSHYPGVDPDLDGIVSIYTYVKSGNHTLSHEAGHYLNLIHTWGNSNDPGLSSNCSIDDNVSDTPNTIGVANGNCPLTQATCGSPLDNVQNFMDYSSCDIMFTNGQKARMRAALNSSIGNRNNLWTASNLTATGTNDGYEPPLCSPIAEFAGNYSNGCQGFTVEFADLSYNGLASSWDWSFPGGQPSISNEQNPSILYSSPGIYNVSLTASNASGSDTKTKSAYIVVKDTTMGENAPFFEDMQSANFPNHPEDLNKKWEINGTGVKTWEKYKFTNNNYTLRVNNYFNVDGDVSNLISPNFIIGANANMQYLEFELAYARRTSTSNDELKVFISLNCGQTWKMKYIRSGSGLATNGGTLITSNFIPTDNQWRTEKVLLGNLLNTKHIMVKFTLTSKSGNYLYIDDIQVGTNATEIVDQFHHQGLNFTIYPNPAERDVNFNFTLPKNGNVELMVTDITGKVIVDKTMLRREGQNTVLLSEFSEHIESGIYIVKFGYGNSIITEKLILTK